MSNADRPRRRIWLLMATASAVIVILDQVTKLLVQQTFRIHESWVVIPGYFQLTYVLNEGAAFGLLRNLPDLWRVPFFVTLSVLALGILLLLAYRVPVGNRCLQASLALLGAGAMGNLIDRVRLGEVVDFVVLHYQAYHWPAFNVADSAISIGLILLLYDSFIAERGRASVETN